MSRDEKKKPTNLSHRKGWEGNALSLIREKEIEQKGNNQ